MSYDDFTIFRKSGPWLVSCYAHVFVRL